MALWALLHAPPLLLHTLTEYCTFIALLGSMYAITGALPEADVVPNVLLHASSTSYGLTQNLLSCIDPTL